MGSVAKKRSIKFQRSNVTNRIWNNEEALSSCRNNRWSNVPKTSLVYKPTRGHQKIPWRRVDSKNDMHGQINSKWPSKNTKIQEGQNASEFNQWARWKHGPCLDPQRPTPLPLTLRKSAYTFVVKRRHQRHLEKKQRGNWQETCWIHEGFLVWDRAFFSFQNDTSSEEMMF